MQPPTGERAAASGLHRNVADQARYPSRGIVLAAVLACLFLAVLLSAGLATTTLHQHRQLRRHARETQAAWLAQSAMNRAAAQLRRDAAYAGETWSIPAVEFDGLHAGTVEITVGADPSNQDRRRVTIEAFFPEDPVERTRVTKTASLPVRGEMTENED